jgi:hypothetical protein
MSRWALARVRVATGALADAETLLTDAQATLEELGASRDLEALRAERSTTRPSPA